jgi:hypothetical protein
VAEHHQVSAREPAPHPAQAACRLAAVVQHRDPEAVQVELRRLGRAPGGHVRAVVVAADRVHRRVLAELVQHRGRAHVARVQDDVGLPQVPGDPRRARLPAARRVRVGQGHHPHPAILA